MPEDEYEGVEHLLSLAYIVEYCYPNTFPRVYLWSIVLSVSRNETVTDGSFRVRRTSPAPLCLDKAIPTPRTPHPRRPERKAFVVGGRWLNHSRQASNKTRVRAHPLPSPPLSQAVFNLYGSAWSQGRRTYAPVRTSSGALSAVPPVGNGGADPPGGDETPGEDGGGGGGGVEGGVRPSDCHRLLRDHRTAAAATAATGVDEEKAESGEAAGRGQGREEEDGDPRCVGIGGGGGERAVFFFPKVTLCIVVLLLAGTLGGDGFCK